MSERTKTLHLALQGGGAHGAFTWGVLDALLQDGRPHFAGISGTSAGAINAVALAHGWAQAEDEQRDPREGARATLARVWTKVMELGAASEGAARLGRLMMGALPGALTRLSPYQANPTSAAEIADRAADLSFNASLIAQMRTIALINELIERGLARQGLAPIRMHRIDGGAALAEMPASSKISPQPVTLEKLFDIGQASAQRWLGRRFEAVGERGTVNLRRDYGDPLKLSFEVETEADADTTPASYLWPPEERARASRSVRPCVARTAV